MKRNPNSITAMLRANAVSSALEDKQRMEDEFSQERESFDQRLRSLRQQYEALKHQYETRIKLLEERLRYPTSFSQYLNLITPVCACIFLII